MGRRKFAMRDVWKNTGLLLCYLYEKRNVTCSLDLCVGVLYFVCSIKLFMFKGLIQSLLGSVPFSA